MREAAAALALGLVLMPLAPALAQDGGTYSLPPAPTQTASPVQGPVDPENPTRPGTTAPSAPAAPVVTPSTAPTRAPTIVLPSPGASAARPAPTRAPAATPTQTAAPTTGAAPETAPLTDAPAFEPAPVETGAVPADPSAAPMTSASPSAEASAIPFWAWLAGGALVVGLGAFLVMRRRRAPPARADWTFEASPAPAPAARPGPAPKPAPPSAAPAPAPAPPPAPAVPLADDGLPGLVFVPESLRLSLVYATLRYRLEWTGSAPAPQGPWQVSGDLISAHSSLDSYAQLAPDPAALERKHEIVALASGEALSVTGELRVPLAAIRPLQRGRANFMVPLVRLVIADTNGPRARRVYTVGVVGAAPGDALGSIRLDDGPRLVTGLAAREIGEARGLPLDPLARAS